jgi:hypothetical protein
MDQRHQEVISKLWRKIEIMDDNIIEMRTPISKLRVVNLNPTGSGSKMARRPLQKAGAAKSAAKAKKTKKTKKN